MWSRGGGEGLQLGANNKLKLGVNDKLTETHHLLIMAAIILTHST